MKIQVTVNGGLRPGPFGGPVPLPGPVSSPVTGSSWLVSRGTGEPESEGAGEPGNRGVSSLEED